MTQNKKVINLALQGGGAHGALAWGALDYMLEDGRLDFEGISATSAGAFNAVVLAQGLLNHDKEEARTVLYSAWKAVSDWGKLHNPCNALWSEGNIDTEYREYSPFFPFFDLLTRTFSPYELNPEGFSPLRDILNEIVDFPAIRKHASLKLHLCATNVETCKIHIFKNEDVSVDAVLASACLPMYAQSVEVKGEYFWDGGYIGNPPLFPLIYDCVCPDILIIHIRPIVRKGVPKSAGEIMHRLNEITFNASLMREMRAVAFITKLIDDQKIIDPSVKRIFIHSLRADEIMMQYCKSSIVNTSWDLFTRLKEQGRQVAKAWLDQHFDQIGQASSVDIHKEFL
ncbi:MAG TPA: patatin-like phospholipase family protein [Gammaproteobacteria bacterium]|nr:patatin-like phospholipase family protein [Gammaproteobacteria bacterium]